MGIGGVISGREILAKNVKKYRLLAKMSQTVLANHCDIELSQISRIELCKISTSIDTIFLIANALRINAAQLLEEDKL
jgi:transcriptional regulator with XRE-family HTH domain